MEDTFHNIHIKIVTDITFFIFCSNFIKLMQFNLYNYKYNVIYNTILTYIYTYKLNVYSGTLIWQDFLYLSKFVLLRSSHNYSVYYCV